MILLDTNILIRYTDATDPTHSVVNSAINSLISQGQTLCIVPQNIYEFWVVATRPAAKNGLGLSIPECQNKIVQFKQLFLLLLDEQGLLAEWEHLVGAFLCSGKVAHDARFVAAMNIHGITQLLTLNTADFARYHHITLIDPTTFAPPAPTP